MKYLLFDGELNTENISKGLDFIQDHEGDLKISLTSDGGNTTDTLFFLDALNYNAERITLVANWLIQSAAFELFYRFKGKKQIIESTTGMFHYVGVTTRIDPRMKASSPQGKIFLESLVREKKGIEEFAASFMNEKELSLFLAGEDVLFNFPRMCEIFPDANILK